MYLLTSKVRFFTIISIFDRGWHCQRKGRRKKKTAPVLVRLSEKGCCETELIPLCPLHDVRRIEGTYDELTLRKNYEGTAVEDYLHVVLTDGDYVPDALYRLRTIYPNILKLEYSNVRTAYHAGLDELSEAAGAAEEPSPLEMFEALYKTQNNEPLSERGLEITRKLFEKIGEKEARA